MKTSIALLGVVTIFSLAVLGAAQPDGKLEVQTSTHSYYPLNIGDKWIYRYVELKSPQKEDVRRIVEIEVDRQEIYKAKNDKGVVVSLHGGAIIKSTSGNKSQQDLVVVLKDGVYRIHTAGTTMNPPLNFFKLPPPKDEKKWEVNSLSGNEVVKGTFTWRQDEVKVPAGAFDAVVVLFSNNEKDEDKRVEVENWFAKDVGMVKQRIRQKGHEHALELEKYIPRK